VKQELQMHGQCEELALDYLSEDAVREYLERRFPEASFAPGFARVLRENTGGNPLFLVNVVDDLVAQRHLREADGRWTLAIPVERVADGVPQTLWQMVEKAARQARAERAGRTLRRQRRRRGVSRPRSRRSTGRAHTTASSAATSSRAWGQFIRALGVAEWPDGTVAARYGFIHALYRDVLYARVPIGTASGSTSASARVSSGRTARAPGRSPASWRCISSRAGTSSGRLAIGAKAAETALGQHGHRQAFDHARRALGLLATLPESPERNQQELMIQTVLGAAVIATSGWAAAEVADAYVRARDLCMKLGVTPQLFPVLLGLCAFYLMRGDLKVAWEVSQELLAVAEAQRRRRGADRSAQHRGHDVLLPRRLHPRRSAIWSGRRRSTTRSCTAPIGRASSSSTTIPGVSCGAHMGLTLMMLGHQDRARRACASASASPARSIIP
jgi:hypothetical protein